MLFENVFDFPKILASAVTGIPFGELQTFLNELLFQMYSLLQGVILPFVMSVVEFEAVLGVGGDASVPAGLL